MATVAEAVGAFARPDALPVAIRRTEVTFVAVTGTVSCAWSCRGVDCASSVPRSHESAPPLLPHPKLNDGFPLPVGAALREIMAWCAFPSVVQALTVHWVGFPRSLLACARVTLTQKTLTCPVSDAGEVLVGVAVPVEVSVPVAGDRLMARVGAGWAAEPLGEGAAVTDLVRVAVGAGLAAFGVGVLVGAFVVAGARVGAAAEVVPDGDGLAVA